MDLPNIDVPDILGDKEGHKINESVDSLGKPVIADLEKLAGEAVEAQIGAFLTKAGFAPTVAGIFAYAQSRADNLLVTSGLPANIQNTGKTLFNDLFNAVTAELPTFTFPV